MEEVYVFSEHAAYELIDGFRGGGMPRGLRYAASITGPWRVFGILDVDDLSDFPTVLTEGKIGSETDVVATYRLERVLKRSAYHPVSAFVRIHTGDVDPEGEGTGREAVTLLEEIRRKAAGDGEEGEAESVMGAFDVLAYVGGENAADLADRIRAIRELPAVLKTLTMRVIDYVSTNPDAPEGHRA